MASAKLVIGSVFQTVATTANTITSTVDTIAVGVAMANDFARNAQRSQRLSNAGHSVGLKRRLAAEISRDQSLLEHEIASWTSKDPALAKIFNETYAEVLAAIEAADNS